MTQTKETVFLTADTVNGVQEGNGEGALTEGGLMDEKYFFDALKTCGNGECIGAYVSPDIYDRIKQVYGIR